VNQYFPTNQTGTAHTWGSRIANFAVPGCGNAGVSPGSLTFSAQALGVASAPQNITLTNGQSVTLSITSITFTGTNSGDFTQTNNCGSSVGPSASCTISVTFTPGGLGTRTALLNVNDSGLNSPQTASLTGTGITPVTLSASSINFGTVLAGSSTTALPVTLTNNQNVPLTNINISISGSTAYSQLNNCGTSIPANGQCAISVTFAPASSGALTGTVNISDSASSSPQAISLTGIALLPVSLNPNALSFGAQAVGTTSASKNIIVTNHEKPIVTFTSITITGADPADFSQTNNCTSLSKGTTCTVSVTFTPTAKGGRTATLMLTDSGTNSPQTAKLAGTGH